MIKHLVLMGAVAAGVFNGGCSNRAVTPAVEVFATASKSDQPGECAPRSLPGVPGQSLSPGSQCSGSYLGHNSGDEKRFGCTWLEPIKDPSPSSCRGGVLSYAPNGRGVDLVDRAKIYASTKASAAAAGIEYVRLSVDTRDEIEVKLAELGDGSAAGVIAFTDATLFRWRSSILETSLRYRLPTVCHQWLAWAEAGCLVTYGEEASAMARRVAAQVDKVLKGTKVGDIPVERPSAFKLILNAKTAKALDLQLPLSLLALADEVIE